MYIERCKHGSEGGLYKPTIEIWQGGTFLPYSYISLYPEGWKENSYVALCGVSGQAMMKQLEQQPEVHEVFLCLDNDKAGHTACARLTEQLREQGDWKVDRLCPQNKDWNDDLRESFSQEQNQEGGMSLAL